MMFYNLDTYLEKLFSSKNMKLANEANEWGLCEIRLFVINLRHCGVVVAIHQVVTELSRAHLPILTAG